MAKVFYDQDADLGALAGRKVAIIGYGNQGRAQALNMRDSGVAVIVGSISDASFERAQADGFQTMSIAEAARAADILFLLVPDEVQQVIYAQDIAPVLRPGQALNFAHGYNIRYGFIKPPAGVDVIMVAPRMIGVGVRERFVAGSGAAAFVAVEQDGTGRAWATTLAIARAIGATRVGALGISFAEETELDHFMEQGLWPCLFSVFKTTYDLLVERGFTPEAVLMELYASGESAKIMDEMAEVGMFRQMNFHSHTSQYGTLSRTPRALPEGLRAIMEKTLDGIKDGSFANEWEAERAAGYPVFNKLKAAAFAHPINAVEDAMKEMLKEGKPAESKV